MYLKGAQIDPHNLLTEWDGREGKFVRTFGINDTRNNNEWRTTWQGVLDNISKSLKGTIRGLHYQVGDKAQGKLCHVIKGKVLDVAVDIRFDSPTFGQYFSIELTGEDKTQMWIPPGFAHGFSVLSDEVLFVYKCTNYYSKPDERAILYNDPQLNIDWKVENPIVSEKDLNAKLINEIQADFVYSPA